MGDLATIDRLSDEVAKLRAAWPKCESCGKPSACIGEYETCGERIAFACDECCGHGNEDGWCVPVSGEAILDFVRERYLWKREDEARIEALRDVIVVQVKDTGGWECMNCNRTAAYNAKDDLEHDAECPLSPHWPLYDDSAV